MQTPDALQLNIIKREPNIKIQFILGVYVYMLLITLGEW